MNMVHKAQQYPHSSLLSLETEKVFDHIEWQYLHYVAEKF